MAEGGDANGGVEGCFVIGSVKHSSDSAGQRYLQDRTLGFNVYILEEAQRILNHTALSDRTSQPCLTLMVEVP